VEYLCSTLIGCSTDLAQSRVQHPLDPASGLVERWDEAALFPACQRGTALIGRKTAFRRLIDGWAIGPIVGHGD
jgi:hypothetical protein